MDYIRYLGHSGFEILLHDTAILIDPFFGSGIPENIKIPVLKPHLIKKADLILITHEHRDHCDPIIIKELAERTNAIVIGPKPAVSAIEINERQKIAVEIGDNFQIRGIDITVVKASHPQSRYPVGYIINDKVKIYHAGDTYQFNEMMQLDIDYALIPIGGSYTMDVLDAANATKLFRAKYIIPIHYNTFERITQDVNDFARRVTRGKVIIMKPDDSIRI
ncbi:MAG: metal-dependent hydrolase [Candidatus Micrarchaeota archaeon]|nr:metal-dependent hydrolase [Candidatus Micrarchaeota archaeon]